VVNRHDGDTSGPEIGQEVIKADHAALW
jgi:hypothetical protein